MRYELKYHGFVHQFGYDVWEILEDGISNGTLYPNKDAAQKEVDFYNKNNISRSEYKELWKTDPVRALRMSGNESYNKLKKFLDDQREESK